MPEESTIKLNMIRSYNSQLLDFLKHYNYIYIKYIDHLSELKKKKKKVQRACKEKSPKSVAQRYIRLILFLKRMLFTSRSSQRCPAHSSGHLVSDSSKAGVRKGQGQGIGRSGQGRSIKVKTVRQLD